MSILSVKTYESTTLIFINLLCFHHFCAISREKPFVFKDFISILGHSFFRALRRIWQPLAARTALRAQKLRKTNVFFNQFDFAVPARNFCCYTQYFRPLAARRLLGAGRLGGQAEPN